MGPENNVGLGGCWIIECLLTYLCMVSVPNIMVRLEEMLNYRGWIIEISEVPLYINPTSELGQPHTEKHD